MIVDRKGSPRPVIPMKSAVLAALGMAWAWGVIAGSVGLNALIKSRRERNRLKALVPPPTVLVIDVNDVFPSGAVVTTVSALIAAICTLAVIHIMLLSTSSNIARALRIHGIVLAFCAVWLLATLIPFTVFVATHSANVTATLNGITLPSSLVDQVERSLGLTRVYKNIDYLRLVAILPWFTVLFTAIAVGVLFIASSRTTSTTTETHTEADPGSSTDTHVTMEKERDPGVRA